jgi:hypothetical protein
MSTHRPGVFFAAIFDSVLVRLLAAARTTLVVTLAVLSEARSYWAGLIVSSDP